MTTFRDKLLAQYKEHGHLIVAVDFDDTLCPSTDAANNVTKRVRRAIGRCNDLGMVIIVFTCRHIEKEVREYLDSKKLTYDHFNESPVHSEVCGFGKPYYNIFLDDKAGLNEALTTLEEVLHVIEEGYDF